VQIDIRPEVDPPMNTTHPSVADRYDSAAVRQLARASRVRERAHEVGDELAPLREAMRRRAAELELTAAALHEIAQGQRVPGPSFDSVRQELVAS